MGKDKKKTVKGYKINNNNKKKTFVLFMEGISSEPNYFRCFTPVKIIKRFPKDRNNKVEFVESAIKTIQTEPDLRVHEVWCVFDFDFSEKEDKSKTFNDGIKLAESKGYRVAYSNDAFELWLLLHFKEISHSKPLKREDIYTMLAEYFGEEYKKNKDFASNLYKLLLDKQVIAIERAEKLHKVQEKIHGGSYHAQNPCTTVYKLVEELNEHLRK
jgi:hypothetical protein